MECVKAELCKETRLVCSAGWLRIPSLIMKGISTGRCINPSGGRGGCKTAILRNGSFLMDVFPHLISSLHVHILIHCIVDVTPVIEKSPPTSTATLTSFV